MKPLDFCTLIDQLSDAGLQFCTDQLYEVLDYKVLKRQDVTPLYLKERIVEFMVDYHRICQSNHLEGMFAEHMTRYINEFISFDSTEQRVFNYSKQANSNVKALRAQADIEKLDAQLAMLDDVFLVYISLFRNIQKELQKNIIISKENPYTVHSAEFYATAKDMDTITCIFRSKQLQFYRQKRIAVKSGPLKTGTKTITEKYEPLNAYDKKFLYICSVLWLCRLLEMEGEI